MVEDLEDPRRSEPSYVLDERDMLEAWLEFHRITLVMKCEGLSEAERKARPVATSQLSLHGIVRHVAEVERGSPCSLRWIYNHMIEEYARHNGHADLIRELVDGAVGW